MSYQNFHAGTFLRLLAGTVIFAILAVVFHIYFLVPFFVWAIASLALLIGAVAWLGLVRKSVATPIDLVGRTASDDQQEMELLSLLHTQANSDSESRGRALQTIREIEHRIDTRREELGAILAMGQVQLPRAALSRSKRILIVVISGWAALMAIAYVRGLSKIGFVLVGFGAISLWLAQHQYFTKQPMYRRGAPPLEFQKEPATHTSAVWGNCALGILLIYLGFYAAL